MVNERKVELIGVLRHPEGDSWDSEDYPVCGAMGCFDEMSSNEIHNQYKVNKVSYGKRGLDWQETKEVIFNETVGRVHGAVADMAEFVFSIDNLTRASTLFLCGPEYASHLQQSLRRATAERGFYSLDDSRANNIMQKQFELYEKMLGSNIPTEDSRIILPLNTKTTIQTKLDSRELVHLMGMANRMGVPFEVYDTISCMYNEAMKEAPLLMKDRGKNSEVLSFFPSSQLFADSNPSLERLIGEVPYFELIDYSQGIRLSSEEIGSAVQDRDEATLANLKHYHFSFLVPMSLMTFHQATRQRTWNQSVEPLTSAVENGSFVTPSSIAKSNYKGAFEDLVNESLDYVRGVDKEGYGVLPHALSVYDLIHINGWNLLHSIGKRTCKTAQWEIRDIAKNISKKVRDVTPEFEDYLVPQGILYGSCPERDNCGFCKS